MRKLLFWFLLGAAIVVIFATAWELVRLNPKVAHVPLIALVVLAPGYFISGWFIYSGAPEGYVIGALVNGTLYAFFGWLVSLVPSDRKWLRRSVVGVPFLLWWTPWIYFEYFAT